MIFLNFSQLLKSVFRSNFSGKHFPETKPNFSSTEKCFPLTNFSNDKQTHESLESDFLKSKFRETNMVLLLLLLLLYNNINPSKFQE